jgi:hypothetical protein
MGSLSGASACPESFVPLATPIANTSVILREHVLRHRVAISGAGHVPADNALVINPDIAAAPRTRCVYETPGIVSVSRPRR